MLHAAPFGLRRVGSAVLVCAVALLFLAVVPSARATGSDVSVTPTNPDVGDSITFTNTEGGECPGTPYGIPVYTFTVTLQGASSPAAQQTSTSLTFTTTLPTAGTYDVSLEMSACQNDTEPFTPETYTGTTVTVGDALSATLSTSPSTVIVNQPVTLSADPDGGVAPYNYAWDLTDSGTFTPASPPTNPTISTTFTMLGEHTVRLRIQDTANGNNVQHTAIITQQIDVVAPTANTPPPPPPPTCYPSVTSGLAYFTTDGCFTQSTTDPNVYTTRSDVMLNGATLTGYGQTFTVTTSPDGGSGNFTAPNSTIAIGGVVVFSGNINWTLPQGGPGDQALAESFTVATGYQFLNLNISGTVSLTLGETGAGSFYSDYGLNLQLPAGFSAGPDPSFGSVTGGASVEVDQSGQVNFGGIMLSAQNVWMGSLQVENVCFAYIPAEGNQANGCPAVSATGSDPPVVSCNSNPDASYWAASVTVDLPSGLRLGASGTLVGGKVGSFSGSLGNLGRTVPLTSGVFLDHIAFGMCLQPPPLIISADVGVNFLGSSHLVSVDGSFTYTDSTQTSPWSIAISGAVSVGDTQIGTATLGFDGNAVINFEVAAGFTALDNIASLNGDVYGWINAPEKEFVVGGDIKGCLAGACADASGEFSSTGVAGCVTIGTSTPTYDLIIPLGGGKPHLDTSTYPITAGFGYVWGNKSVDLLGGSCDFSDYEPADAFSARAAGGNTQLRTKVASGTEAVALRIRGTHGPPRIVVHGPHGVTISSPSKGILKRSKGHYMLIENRTNGTADLMLLRPAAGTWTISQAPHSVSSLTTMDRANLEVPPTFGARVKARGAHRTLQVAYAVPVGAKVRLVEHAKGVEHTLAKDLQGSRCPGLPVFRPHTDERILCSNITFAPSLGPTRKRQVVAFVSKGAIPLMQKTIASFTAPPLRLPSRVAAMRVQRGKDNLVISFARSSTAAHYAVSAKLTDGRELAYYLGARCHALKIEKVPAGVGAAVKVAGVRYDLKLGRARTISIGTEAKSSGKKSKKLKQGRVCS